MPAVRRGVSIGQAVGEARREAKLTSMPTMGIKVTISKILQKEKRRPPSMLGSGTARQRQPGCWYVRGWTGLGLVAQRIGWVDEEGTREK
jgi:hypothetical protein